MFDLYSTDFGYFIPKFLISIFLFLLHKWVKTNQTQTTKRTTKIKQNQVFFRECVYVYLVATIMVSFVCRYRRIQWMCTTYYYQWMSVYSKPPKSPSPPNHLTAQILRGGWLHVFCKYRTYTVTIWIDKEKLGESNRK